MKKILISTAVIAFVFASCGKGPTSCYVADKGKTAKVNEEVQFDASCSKNADSYSWSFGDGTPPTTGMNVKHKFLVADTFIVALTTTNGSKNNVLTSEFIIQP